jgi:sarcosine oxidase, subunit delta
MKLLRCPLNGERPLLEFVCGGEVRDLPLSVDGRHSCSDAEWTAYLLNRNSVPRVRREWWCHTPSGYWFIAERDTARDAFLRSYDASDPLGAGREGDAP